MNVSVPFVRIADDDVHYPCWRIEHTIMIYGTQTCDGQFLGTFQELPPSRHVSSFSLDNTPKIHAAQSTEVLLEQL